jgi:prophage regulatory protein
MTTLLRLAVVRVRVGLATSTIYQMISAGTFPRPVHIGPRASRWVESEIEDWIQASIALRNSIPLAPPPPAPEPERWSPTDIEAWLREQLGDGKARNDISMAAYRRGIPWAHVKRAAVAIGVHVEYVGTIRKCYWIPPGAPGRETDDQ